MKLVGLTLENVRTFGEQCRVDFDHRYNVLVGPNGGGKSNLLDIVTVVLRHFFMHGYRVNEGSENGQSFRDLQREQPFQHLDSTLGSFQEHGGERKLQVELCVTHEDIQSMREIKAHINALTAALRRYRNKPLSDLDVIGQWSPEEFRPGEVLQYSIAGERMMESGAKEGRFLQFVHFHELMRLLSADISGLSLPSTFLFFSPYRGTTDEQLTVNLAQETLNSQLVRYFAATSRTASSLIKLASLHFAEKRRLYEGSADKVGFETRWQDDPEVALVTRHMANLGYSWDLRLIDARKNIYEMSLARNGRSFTISRASSGEREVLNFMIGLFAFNVQGGIVVIDEPELHLHPRWQAAVRELLQELAEVTGNQIIMATHSPMFITPDNISKMMRVSRGTDGATKINRIPDGQAEHKKALLHLVTSHNNEKMLFADKVVLVEGIMDRLLFDAIIGLYSAYLERTAVIDILEVHGKSNFDRYRTFLRNLDVQAYVIADLDYVLNVGDATLRSLLRVDPRVIDRKVFGGKKSKDRAALLQMLQDAVNSGDLAKINLAAMRQLFDDISARHLQIRHDLNSDEEAILDACLNRQREDGIYILRQGEIEQYLPVGYKELDGLIELTGQECLVAWLNKIQGTAARAELDSISFSILEATDRDRTLIKQAVSQSLQPEEARRGHAGTPRNASKPH